MSKPVNVPVIKNYPPCVAYQLTSHVRYATIKCPVQWFTKIVLIWVRKWWMLIFLVPNLAVRWLANTGAIFSKETICGRTSLSHSWFRWGGGYPFPKTSKQRTCLRSWNIFSILRSCWAWCVTTIVFKRCVTGIVINGFHSRCTRTVTFHWHVVIIWIRSWAAIRRHFS